MLEQSAADRFSRIVAGAQEEGDNDWLAARGLHHLAPPVDQSSSERIAPTSSVLEEPNLERASAVETARSVWVLALAQRHVRSEEHTSELQSLMRISYAVFCLKKKNNRI